MFISANARRKCHFRVLMSATTELGCWNDVDNSTADKYLLLNPKSRRKYTILIKFDIGIPMLARTMSHWYRFDAVQLYRRWNFVEETTSTIRCPIDHLHRQTWAMTFLYHFDIVADVGSISINWLIDDWLYMYYSSFLTKYIKRHKISMQHNVVYLINIHKIRNKFWMIKLHIKIL